MDMTKSKDMPRESPLLSSAVMRSTTSSGVCAKRFAGAIIATTKQIINAIRFICCLVARVWLAVRRGKNRKNCRFQELLEFIEMREKEIEVDREKPGDIIYTPNINPDGITTIHIPLSETAN